MTKPIIKISIIFIAINMLLLNIYPNQFLAPKHVDDPFFSEESEEKATEIFHSKENNLVEKLFSMNPFKAIQAYKRLKRSFNLIHVKELVEFYPKANFYQKIFISKLVYWITANVAITEKYFRITHARKRFKVIKIFIKQILELLKEIFPQQSVLKIQEDGISTGEISLNIYNYLKKNLDKKFIYTAGDLVTELIYFSDSFGNTAIFRHNTYPLKPLVQIVDKDGNIYGDAQQVLPFNQFDSQLLNKFMEAYDAYVGKKQMTDQTISVKTASIISPEVVNFSKTDPDFNIHQNNILIPPPEISEKQHFIFLQNVVTPQYFSTSERENILTLLGRRLEEKGLLFLINEQYSLGVDMEGEYDYHWTLFQRRDGKLIALSHSNDWFGNHSFDNQRNNQIIKEVELYPTSTRIETASA